MLASLPLPTFVFIVKSGLDSNVLLYRSQICFVFFNFTWYLECENVPSHHFYKKTQLLIQFIILAFYWDNLLLKGSVSSRAEFSEQLHFRLQQKAP